MVTSETERGSSATEALADNEPVAISLAEATELVPHSKKTLYRVAEKGGEDSPFTKLRGRWTTTPEKLRKWDETGEKPRKRDPVSRDPMPGPGLPKVRAGNIFRDQVMDLHGRKAS